MQETFRAVSPVRDADHRPGARPASFCVVRKGRMTTRGRTKTQRLHWRGRRRSGGDAHGDVPLFHAVRPMTISLPSQPRKALTDGSSPFRMLMGSSHSLVITSGALPRDVRKTQRDALTPPEPERQGRFSKPVRMAQCCGALHPWKSRFSVPSVPCMPLPDCGE